jgi:hypothetical protein
MLARSARRPVTALTRFTQQRFESNLPTQAPKASSSELDQVRGEDQVPAFVALLSCRGHVLRGSNRAGPVSGAPKELAIRTVRIFQPSPVRPRLDGF